MKILVLVKEIVNTETKIDLEYMRKRYDGKVDHTINIFDEYALEEAIKIREKHGGEVILFSVCREHSIDTYRYFMAMGIDKGMLILSETKDSKVISELLGSTIKEHHNDYDLILAGWAGIDFNNGQVPGRLSQILDIPLINVVTKLEIDGGELLCEREGDNNQEIIESMLPAIVTVQRGINTPRRPTAIKIMESQKDKVIFIQAPDSKDNQQLDISYQLPKSKKDVFKIEQTDDNDKAVELLIDKLMEDKVL